MHRSSCSLLLASFKCSLADCSCFKAEEIQNASVIIPRSMFSSILLNGGLGFGMLIAVLFSAGNIEQALDSPTKYPYIEIFAQAVGSYKGATGMVSQSRTRSDTC